MRTRHVFGETIAKLASIHWFLFELLIKQRKHHFLFLFNITGPMRFSICFLSTILFVGHAFVQPQRKFQSLTRLQVSETYKLSKKARELATKDSKVCIITGASQGLGQAMAYELVSPSIC